MKTQLFPSISCKITRPKLLILVCVFTLLIIATIIMAPRLTSPVFGLLDDGVTVRVSRILSQDISQGNIAGLLELEINRGRFRPIYWIYLWTQCILFGENPLGFFVIQWCVFSFTVLAIFGIVHVISGEHLPAFFSALFFLFSPPIFENYYTLSKPEVPLVLWLVLSIYFLLKQINSCQLNHKFIYFLLSAVFLLLAYFTKETVIIMVVISAFWAGLAFWKYRNFYEYEMKVLLNYFYINMILLITFCIGYYRSSIATIITGTDSLNYTVKLDVMLVSLLRYIGWYARDFPYLFFLLIVFFIFYRVIPDTYRTYIVPMVTGSLIWIGGWTLIMLPWHSTLEYYLLPVSAGIAILSGTVLISLLKKIKKISIGKRLFVFGFSFLSLILMLVTIPNGYTNGYVQIAVDSANKDLIDYLANNLPNDSIVFVNLPVPNEYISEIELHLSVFEGRSDITVYPLEDFSSSRVRRFFVVTPYMKNEALPIVRIAVHEDGAKLWNSDLQLLLGGRLSLQYSISEHASLFYIAIEHPICPLLIYKNVEGGVFCQFQHPFADTRLFEYGWDIYKVELPYK